MSHGRRGNAREQKVAKELRDAGWEVKGTGDAHGAVDLMAIQRGRKPIVVQVKGTAVARGAFGDFKPKERRELLEAAERGGANAWLAWAPPDRKPTRWIEPQDWPPLR